MHLSRHEELSGKWNDVVQKAICVIIDFGRSLGSLDRIDAGRESEQMLVRSSGLEKPQAIQPVCPPTSQVPLPSVADPDIGGGVHTVT